MRIPATAEARLSGHPGAPAGCGAPPITTPPATASPDGCAPGTGQTRKLPRILYFNGTGTA